MTRKQMIERMHMIEHEAIAGLGRSAWDQGVAEYIRDLMEDIADQLRHGYIEPWDVQTLQGLRRAMLNGASSWAEYSEGGLSLVYNADIAARLCTPSELKRTEGGRKNPNPSESWIDVQARALWQAGDRIARAYR